MGSLGAEIDSQLTRFAAYGFAGAVLVVRDGRIVLLKGYGQADVARRIPNTPATRFEMNSMTKMFTGAAILQLAGEGRLDLGAPIARYVPGLPPAKQGATIEQLAAHTSGLIVAGTSLAGESRDAFLADVARTPRESAPGERYRYTNAGYSVLAAIIEIITGDTYETYLRQHIFAPATMHTAVFRNEVPSNDSCFAHGYVGTAAGLEPGPPNPYVWGTIGAGGVWATLGDMYRWLIALEERRVLGEAQWRMLTTPPRPPSKEAFGWHVETASNGHQRISKGGGSDDFASQLLYYPDERTVIIWASNNLRQRWRSTLNVVLPALVSGDETISLPAVATLPPAALARRSARYRSGTADVEIRSGDGYLYATANRLGIPAEVMFFPQNDHHFTAFDPVSGVVTTLEADGSDGRSLTFTLAGGRRVVVQRLE